MIHEMRWNNKEQLKLKNWATYSCQYERLGTFITNANSCILLFSLNVSVSQITTMYRYKVVHIFEKATEIFEIILPIFVDYVDYFSDGQYIFAKSRTFYEEGPNVIIANALGSITGSFVAGDGISHLQVDEKEQIWIGYSIDNKRNNHAWPASAKIGRHGVAIFNKEGSLVFDPKNLEIMYTTAMNVTKDRTFIIAQSYSQLVHLFDKQSRLSKECIDINIGQLTLAEEQSLIVVDDRDELKRLILDGIQYIVGHTIEITDEKGTVIKGEIKIRNKAIFCFTGDNIYRITNV